MSFLSLHFHVLFSIWNEKKKFPKPVMISVTFLLCSRNLLLFHGNDVTYIITCSLAQFTVCQINFTVHMRIQTITRVLKSTNAIWTTAAYIHKIWCFSALQVIFLCLTKIILYWRGKICLISNHYTAYVQGVTKRMAPSLTNLLPQTIFQAILKFWQSLCSPTSQQTFYF